MQPYARLGWWQWMYRLSPYTYLIEALLGQAIGKQPIQCSAVELVQITPPSGQTCAEYMGPYIATAGGYLTNPSASSVRRSALTGELGENGDLLATDRLVKETPAVKNRGGQSSLGAGCWVLDARRCMTALNAEY